MKYIVTIDRPYYPSVYYFDDLEAAIQRRDEIVRDNAQTDGQYGCRVVIASVIDVADIKTYF